jgi:hypothetical protein
MRRAMAASILLLMALAAACSKDSAGFLPDFLCDCSQPDGGVVRDGYNINGTVCLTHDDAEQVCSNDQAQLTPDAGVGGCEVIRSSCSCSVRGEPDCGGE